MADRSIYFDRFGTLRIQAYACKIDKSILPTGPLSDSETSPYFPRTDDSSDFVTCSLLEEEAAEYGYKIPATSNPAPAASEQGATSSAFERKLITFRPVFTTGINVNRPIRSCLKSASSTPGPRKTVKFKIDPKPFTRGISYQRDAETEQNLCRKLNGLVPIVTHRSALTSSRQYPEIESRYVFNKYAHIFGLARKPEFSLKRSRTEETQ